MTTETIIVGKKYGFSENEAFIDGIEQERAKWFPLYQAIKDLEKYDDFRRDEPNRFEDALHSKPLKFKELWDSDKAQIILARRALRQALIVLRASGEK